MLKNLFRGILFCISISMTSNLISFDKVVIWGFKLHSHTNSYVFDAFYKAFQYLGYDVYHLDNQDDISNFDFSNALFFTEGQADQMIPLRKDCFYILHNCEYAKYQELYLLNRCICLQVYSDDVLDRRTAICIEPCIYEDITNKVIYMPWATDQLPPEIERNKQYMINLKLRARAPYVFWGGTYGGGFFGNKSEIDPFIETAKQGGIQFVHQTKISPKAMVKYVQNAYMAPTIVGSWQKEKGYIPCRIFKNISYGQMGITNSYRVYELFNRKIVYDPDTTHLFYKACKAIESWNHVQREELMDFVKDHHTYINRIYSLLTFFHKVNNEISL